MRLKQYAPKRLAQEISATSIISQVFAFYILMTYLILRFSPVEWLHRDPILNLLPATGIIAYVIALSLITMLLWLIIAKPTPEVFKYCLREAVLGLLIGLICVVLLRFLVGEILPPFIPSEETAKPGIVLNMTAGYGEEVFFRLLILPMLFFTFIRFCRYQVAVICSVILLAFIFALLHQLGTLEPGINFEFFTTRMLVPGIVLSLLFFYRSPTFAVIFHSATHILIPFVFFGN